MIRTLPIVLLATAPLTGAAGTALIESGISCPAVAGRGIGLASGPPDQLGQVRLDLVLETVRHCPADFAAVAGLFSEPDSPLNALVNLARRDPLTVALARDAAYALAKKGYLENDKTAVRMADLLGRPRRAGARVLRAVEERESVTLAAMAASLKSRGSPEQGLLLDGVLIMWIVNRGAINSAFEKNHAAQQWLKPYPPGVVMVGPSGGTSADDELAEAIRRTASRFSGPVDLYFRGYRVEH